MQEFKTVWDRDFQRFDKKINAAIQEGWRFCSAVQVCDNALVQCFIREKPEPLKVEVLEN